MAISENEKDIKIRTERESEILIQNLGKTKSIDRSELIFDTENIRSLVCMHESLQWFTVRMKGMLSELPRPAMDILKNCVILNKNGSEEVMFFLHWIRLILIESCLEIAGCISKRVRQLGGDGGYLLAYGASGVAGALLLSFASALPAHRHPAPRRRR